MSTVEDRLTDALAARAQLETVAPEALAQHVEEVRAAVDDDVTPVGREGAGPGAQWVPPLDEVTARRRRRVVVALAAAAAAVLAAAAVGLVLVGTPTDEAAPAAGWAERDFSVLSQPQTPDDLLPVHLPAPPGLLPGSTRQLASTPAVRAWVATTDEGRVCLVLQALGAGGDPEGSASGCADEADAEADASGGGVQLGLQTRTAHLMTDHDDPAGSVPDGLVPLARNLRVDAATAREGGVADLLADAQQSTVRGPYAFEESQDLPPVTEEGSYAVLLRCLTTASVVVEVNGVAAGPSPCTDGWSDPVVHLAAVGSVAPGGDPLVVRVDAPDGAWYAVAVVRGEAEFQG